MLTAKHGSMPSQQDSKKECQPTGRGCMVIFAPMIKENHEPVFDEVIKIELFGKFLRLRLR